MCEHCPVVKGLTCSVCGHYNKETNGAIVVAGVRVELCGTTVRYHPRRSMRHRDGGFQQCGGGRRVIRKKIRD